MKTHLTSIISHLKSALMTFFFGILETLLPARIYRQNAPDALQILQIKAINQGRIFGPEPFTHSAKSSRAFFSYRDPEIKNYIWKFKYYLRHSITEQFSHIMADELVAHLSDTLDNNPFNTPALLVYCPSSSFASGNKAFDHMEKLVLNIESLINRSEPFLQACTNAICINKNIESQHHGNKKERLAWANNRFSLSESFKEHLKNSLPAHIICIDDIITTGATFNAIKNLFSKEVTIKRTHQEFFALCFTELGKAP